MITILIIAVTSIISIIAFSNKKLFYLLQFNAYQIYHRREVHRMLTHGFVHANWWHLIVNMMVLYFFGASVENNLSYLAESGSIKSPVFIYLIFYLLSIVFASSISLVKYKNNHWYNSVGASGAVGAVLFFSIFFNPWTKVYLYGIIGIPGILFGVLYLIYSRYMSKKGGDNINHDAHFLGSVFGFVFPIILDGKTIYIFMDQILKGPH